MPKEDRTGAVKKDEAPKARADRSPMYFYTCAHGASNEACPEHFPGQPDMPDDWMSSYVAPTPPPTPTPPSGISDDLKLR